jgi:bifunctional N-acetylglucosamine-1-phosphate-uridyltransferase/glucosamine-1-phosphate-acetyltransferase GlmU-like protein
MMSAFGKNMKKYAEVGLHRLAVALPTRVSNDDLVEYTNRIVKLAEKSRIILYWIQYIDHLKNGVSLIDPKNDFMEQHQQQQQEMSPNTKELLSKKVQLSPAVKEKLQVELFLLIVICLIVCSISFLYS